MSQNIINFFISIPHSGEKVPAEVTWLQNLAIPKLMRDVDRFVDQLYSPVIAEMNIPAIITEWHRYVVDLNRFTDEFDQQAVSGAHEPAGKHPKGLHWSITTQQEELIPSPMSMELHNTLVENYYQPFHDAVQEMRKKILTSRAVYQLDAHSMPSVGTALHADPGERRADIVVSDYHGTSCSPEYRDLVMAAYQKAGFQVAYNHPYVGGGITRMYGEPEKNCHTIQVEINRDLYMNETSKDQLENKFAQVQKQVSQAVKMIYTEVKEWA